MKKESLFSPVPALILAAALAAGCGGAQKTDKAVADVLKARKIVDLEKLTGSEVRLLTSIVKKEASPCGASLSLLEELSKVKPCPLALRALGFYYRRILDGYPESDIIDQYVARFQHSPKLAIATEGCPALGPADAPVTIVVFSDFACPFCRKAAAFIAKVSAQHGDKVRVVFKHFPMTDLHDEAMDAALAAEAAFQQGRFWEMHDKLFALEGQLSSGNLEKAAQDAGIDIERWKEDKAKVETADRVDGDKEEGKTLKVQGTPTIFVNGVEFKEPAKYLEEYVEETLAGGE